MATMNTSGGTGYAAIPNKADVEMTVVEQSPTTRAKNSDNFFSWIKDDETRKTSIKDAKVIPWLGIIALLVSVLTTLLSLGLLLIIQHRRELVPTTGVWKMLQPASWLSAFMSLNAAALHLALGEGVTIAWWFRATRPTATIDQLHSIWATGTSLTSAVADVRKLSYISLATLFVAILPLNAFLLQAAINTPVAQIQRWEKVPVPIVRELPAGYSAYFNGGEQPFGTIDPYRVFGNWPGVAAQLKNAAGSRFARYAYIGAYDQCLPGQTNCTDTYMVDGTTPPVDQLLSKKYYFNDTLSTFSFKAEGTGFKVECTNSTKPFDLVVTEAQPEKEESLFYTYLEWDYTKPNEMTLSMYWKSTPDCSGQLEVRDCTFTAAVVEYPIEMKLDLAKQYRGPYFSLPLNTSWRDDKVIREIPPYADEHFTNTSDYNLTRYGGIGLKLNNWFWANVSLANSYTNPWLVTQDGPLGQAVDPGIWDGSNDFDACTFDVRTGLSYVNYFQRMTLDNEYDVAVEFGPWDYGEVGDPTDLVINQIRQAMFLASVSEGAGWWSRAYAREVDTTTFNRTGNEADYIQTVDALLTKNVPVYKIRWYFWGLSVGLTYLVILIILPTFWGFWVLARKPTMSPIDMSRALNAPIIDSDEQHRAHVDQLLKDIGHKNIHSDLRR